MKKRLLIIVLMISVAGFAHPRAKDFIPNSDRKKQTASNKVSKSPNAIKQALDSIVAPEAYKIVYDYDKNGNNILEVYYNWDEFNILWIGSSKNEYKYDARGNETLYISYSWDNEINDWTIFYKEESEYDEKNNLTQVIRASWANNELVMKFKNEFEYDDNGNETVDILYDWDYDNNDWIKLFKGESAYNDNGSLATYIDHEWLNNVWVAYYKIEHSYDGNINNVLWIIFDRIDYEWVFASKGESEYDSHENKIHYVESIWSGDSWVKSFEEKNVYEYDVAGNITLNIYYSSDWMTGELTPISKNIYEYDANKNVIWSESYGWDEYLNDWTGWNKYVYEFNSTGYLDMMICYSYDNDNWIFSYKSDYKYDVNWNIILMNYYLWEENSWVQSQKTEHTFNLTYSLSELIFPLFYPHKNMLLEEKDSYWDGAEWNTTISTGYWSAKDIEESVTEITPSRLSITIYPNPVSDILNISIEDSDIIPNVKIYSIQGALMIHKQGNQIDISSLGSGTYFAMVNGQCKKIVKQ